jgi:predicted  nucleic acid-binding Zn-ribbon protein
LREEINRLMDLQVIDRQLKELEQSLSSIAGRVDQLRDENKSNQAELDRLTEQDKEITAARKKAERELAEGEVRIRNKRMRLTLVRNDKELQALTHEIESLKDTNQRLETELLTSMEGADVRTRKSPRRSKSSRATSRRLARRARKSPRMWTQACSRATR